MIIKQEITYFHSRRYGATGALWRLSVATLKRILRELQIAIPKTKGEMVDRLDQAYRKRRFDIHIQATFTTPKTTNR